MINFICQDVKAKLKGRRIIRTWIRNILKDREFNPGEINIVFCSDKYILELNKQSLGHDYYTDIITFDYTEGDVVNADLFISLDTVMANSLQYKQLYAHKLESELCRVIIHGVLHTIGENDHTAAEQKRMRRCENAALQKIGDAIIDAAVQIRYKSAISAD